MSRTGYSILIIGGGVIGLGIARELHRLGVRDIAVADRGNMGREASWAAAGMLAPNAETEAVDDFYRLCVESNEMYPRFAEELKYETGIDIEFDPSGTLELAFDEENARRLDAKFARQAAAGIHPVRLDRTDVLELEPLVSPAVVSGLHYPNDGHVNNRSLVKALCEFSQNSGIDLVEESEVTEVLPRSAGGFEAVATGRQLSAERIVLATGAWSSLIKLPGAANPLAVRPVKGQILAFAGASPLIAKVIYGEGAYLVPRAGGRLLVGATVENAGFDRELSSEAAEQLRGSAIRTVPSIAGLEIVDQWCGFRPLAESGSPIMGELPDVNGIIVATGHYRNGILLAPLTAKLIAEHIVRGTRSPYLEAFSPGARASAGRN